MAIFHSHVQIISRVAGKSAVAAAAYRAGESIKNEYDGIIHDYTRKGGIVHTEILLPSHAPAEYSDRAVLWNAVEKIEKAENSQLARELDIALPAEFTREQSIALAREYVKRTFVSAGMCADLCVHDKGDGNPHCHIMLTMRPIDENGKWGAKQKKEYILDNNGNKIYDPKKRQYKCRSIPSTDWNDRGKADEWRKAWEDMSNAELERLGFDCRISRLSYEEQGIEQVPTIHMGAAAQMEQRGIRTERGDQNRAIAVSNQMIRQLRGRIKSIEKWVYTQPIQDAPTIGEMMSAVNRGQNLNSRWKRIASLQTQAKVLMFIQENGVYSMTQLAAKITELHQSHDLAGEVKKKERRITALNEHLAQVETYKQHGTVYKRYKTLDPKKRGAYAEKHAGEIAEYEAAARYLKDHLNGRIAIPEKEWRAERDRLLAERYANVETYYKLRDDVRSMEVLRRGVENIVRDEPQRTEPTKTRGMEVI